MKIFLILIILTSKVWANSISLSVNPKSPVKEQSFYLDFEIETNSNGTPVLSFDPGKAEVLGRQSNGVEISTTLVNGRLTTRRVLKYRYELVAPTSGFYFIKEIEANIDGLVLKHEPIRFQVVAAPIKKPAFFVQAEPKKRSYYLREVIYLNYYYYSKVGQDEFIITEFPKLNKFLKSFAGSPPGESRDQTVEVDGEIYRKSLIYKTKLYAQQPGKLSFDPIKLKVRYIQSNQFNPFQNFGLGGGRIESQNISSEKVEVEILPLPASNVPNNFTGLVGDHEFSVEIPKTKVLVNEAIEAKVFITGEGALEEYEGPELFAGNSIKSLEAFDRDSDLSINEDGPSNKVIKYTYLARANDTIPARELKISYFNPDTKSYEEKVISLPGLEISGTAQNSLSIQSGNNQPLLSQSSSANEQLINLNETDLLAPIFEENSLKDEWPLVINTILGITLFIYLLYFLIKEVILNRKIKEAHKILKSIKKEGLNYPKIFHLTDLLGKKTNADPTWTLKRVVQESPLTGEAKGYFCHLIDIASSQGYDKKFDEKKFNYEEKYFNELNQIL
jgi:hypothetical protein